MAISGRKGSDREPRRALLLISLILLLWNLGATLLPPEKGGAPRRGTIAVTAGESAGGGNVSIGLPAASARSGAWTIRQKFLAGKRVDINTATESEISELPGISDAVAAAVVAERARIRRFRTPQDLLGVKGIKQKRLQKILPFLADFENN